MPDVHPLLILAGALILVFGAQRRRGRYRGGKRYRGRKRRSRRSAWAMPEWLVSRFLRRAPADPMTCGVYVLSNPAFDGLLKIGFTRRHVRRRMAELSRPTGVPRPFELVAFFPTSRPERDEARVHAALRERRVSGKEFFACTPREAVACCQRLVGDGYAVRGS
jgi:hypothetical protein